MAGIFGIVTSGLLAFQNSIVTRGHNIANVNTPGYSRQTNTFSTNTPQLNSGQYFGSGVSISSVIRNTNEFISERIRTTVANEERYNKIYEFGRQVESFVGDPNLSISAGIEEFFNNLQSVNDEPATTSSRQVLFSQAGTLIDRFHTMYTELDNQKEAIDSELSGLTAEINVISSEIASINDEIGKGVNAPDTLDRLYYKLKELSELVSVSVLEQDNGSINVFIGAGQPLIVGGSRNTLSTAASTDDPRSLDVTLSTASGGTQRITTSISGGKLGGLLEFAEDNLELIRRRIGRVALALQQDFNDQHRLGMDLDGNLGGYFFSQINTATTTADRVIANSSNSGTGIADVDIIDANQLTDSEYRLTVTNVDGVTNVVTYDLVKLSDNSTVVSGGTFDMDLYPESSATVDGFRIDFTSGTYADGDTYVIAPTRNASRDIALNISSTSEIAVASPIRTITPSSNIGTGAISQGIVTDRTAYDVDGADTYTVTFSGSPLNYTVTDSGANVEATGVYTAGSTISFNGIEIEITGTPNLNDTFTVEVNASGTNDNRNGLQLAALKDVKSVANGVFDFQQAYDAVVSDLAVNVRQADVNSEALQSLRQQAENSLDAVAGVNIDEEMIGLLDSQRGYQAIAQVIGISERMFSTLTELI